jgi:phosphoglucomutase
MIKSPLAGLPAPLASLVDVPRLVTAYYTGVPDSTRRDQRVAFGTSGHRGSSFQLTFNEPHVLAIAQAICLYRALHDITGPLFLGLDTHALSIPAAASAIEVLAANGVVLMIAAGDEYTPTPVISHAILTYNRGRKSGLADGIVITPSHNPPHDGGFKYNPPHGGPAEAAVTGWIEAKSNALLEVRLAGVRRMPYARALRAPSTHRHDFLTPYINDLGSCVDLDCIRDAKLRLGVDPLGGAGVHYWPRIAEKYGLDLTVVSDVVDPTFRFMTVDWDGQIRMDPSSPCAMQRLISLKDRFDLCFACDPDHDRHGIVTPGAGLLPPNHYLSTMVDYLFPHRPRWTRLAGVGKTMVSTAMVDRVAARLDRRLGEVPVGFKWFVAGLLDGALGLAGEESAGATFLRRDGTVWTTDKDGFVPCLLAAEMTVQTGEDPGNRYRALTREFGAPSYDRIEAPATAAEKAVLAGFTSGQFTPPELAGEKVEAVLTRAPGTGTPFGGLKVVTATGWFAARPSGTEASYRIYGESFQGDAHLRRILAEARTFVRAALAAVAVPARPGPLWPAPHQTTDQEAIEVWENEGDPN